MWDLRFKEAMKHGQEGDATDAGGHLSVVIWRAEGKPGELDLACRLARQALAWTVGQRQPVLRGPAHH